jgi:hypothetical protein
MSALEWAQILGQPYEIQVDGGGAGARGGGNCAISGYVRFAPHWGNRGCETPRVTDVVAGALGEQVSKRCTSLRCPCRPRSWANFSLL